MTKHLPLHLPIATSSNKKCHVNFERFEHLNTTKEKTEKETSRLHSLM